MEKDEDIALVRRAISQLIEHFDAVQIFVSRHDGGEEETMAIHLGEGNWYARFGQVMDWMNKENAGASDGPGDD